MEYEENDYEFEPESESYVPEEVRPPSDATEWFECVYTEYAWLTDGRVLPLTTPIMTVMKAMLARAVTPDAAAKYLIEKLIKVA